MSINVPLLKLAARAWKQNYLSEDSRARLENAGVLNYDKELSGLTLGSDNIARKKGIAEEFVPGEVVGETLLNPTTIIEHPNGTRELKHGLHIRYGDVNPIGMFNDGKNSRGGKATSRNWDAQLIRRHELDEASLAHKKFQKLKRKYEPQILGDATHRLRFSLGREQGLDELDKELLADIKNSGVYSHVSPEVLLRESGNLAGAPREVREDFIAARKYRPSRAHRFIRSSFGGKIGLGARAGEESIARSEFDSIADGGLNYGTQAKRKTKAKFNKEFNEALHSNVGNWNSRSRRGYQALMALGILGTGYGAHKLHQYSQGTASSDETEV